MFNKIKIYLAKTIFVQLQFFAEYNDLKFLTTLTTFIR